MIAKSAYAMLNASHVTRLLLMSRRGSLAGATYATRCQTKCLESNQWRLPDGGAFDYVQSSETGNALLSLSRTDAYCNWKFARAWLQSELSDSSDTEAGE